MIFFCLFWMPLFYLFWRTVTGNTAVTGGVWALLLGSVVALVQFFLGYLVEPGGFGLSRWVSGCIDIVTLPALAPLLLYFFLVSFRIIRGTIDFATFAILWLIPGAAIRAVSWSSLHDPILLVLVPILWTSIAVGAAFFINLIVNGGIFTAISASLAILIIPFAATSSYWAFYSQMAFLGFMFLLAAAAPMLVSIFLSFLHARGGS